MNTDALHWVEFDIGPAKGALFLADPIPWKPNPSLRSLKLFTAENMAQLNILPRRGPFLVETRVHGAWPSGDQELTRGLKRKIHQRYSFSKYPFLKPCSTVRKTSAIFRSRRAQPCAAGESSRLRPYTHGCNHMSEHIFSVMFLQQAPICTMVIWSWLFDGPHETLNVNAERAVCVTPLQCSLGTVFYVCACVCPSAKYPVDIGMESQVKCISWVWAERPCRTGPVSSSQPSFLRRGYQPLPCVWPQRIVLSIQASARHLLDYLLQDATTAVTQRTARNNEQNTVCSPVHVAIGK